MAALHPIAVVIPCLNEEATIGSVIAAVRHQLPRIIVVDDGSTDATAGVAEHHGAQVVRHAANRGKGAAIETGLATAVAAGCEWVLLMDGDGQHDPADIPALLRAAAEGDADMVLGNRMHQAAAIPWLRRQVNRWMSRDISTWTGADIPDSQCGFRMVRLAAWNQARPGGDGFVLESDMIVAFLAAGFRVGHAPVRVLPRFRGRSRIQALRDTIRWFRWRRVAQARWRKAREAG